MQRPVAAATAAENAVITKATLRAADLLEITARTLALVIGVSEATVSRMRKQEFLLERGTKPFELAVLFVRLFRSLDAIVGGDETVARTWLKNPNTALDGTPLEKILTIAGLVDVIAYLDSRRALV
ncbi:transcriptional regulator, XRE family protein [Mesorhizobium sp. WSM3879]|uniref:antitoxin Xre/MbcA/ParS toxin-binding domain-containing protein n=1 Tax=Mesorhizobium sp. WSM3879 TaxID=2029406 RepID=UPI000BAF3FF4|nr:antitoxin Xre/MbcA/ParS toxin-binding domain-containing protein [Mesorhizobium sp. WSM3879]PBB78307.1 transcriptional regulator, XRE family protein [Mesorhizobium sp. WSM3879]